MYSGRLAILTMCLGLRIVGAEAQGICPADRPIIVLHCGSSTVIRCGGRDYTCPEAKVKVVTKTVVKVMKAKAGPRRTRLKGPLDFLLHR